MAVHDLPWSNWFRPDPQVDRSRFDGAGAYADYRGGHIDEKRLHAIGLSINWDGVFPYAYHGLWMPCTLLTST